VDIIDFQKLLSQKGHELYRDMPWRDDTRPYYVLVSELMLQQTQVERVVPKFTAFIEAFPNEKILAQASLGDVLKLWQGLGYNRRAKFLHDSAKKIVDEYDGIFPQTKEPLMTLPGVGPNTAGAIIAYSFNQPAVFIETNIRTVYFYHFFETSEKVADSDIARLVEETLDTAYPRQFYWAIMDYGSWLKRQGLGGLSQSKHYKKQSALIGSVREVRGRIITLLSNDTVSISGLKKQLKTDDRFELALDGLMRDGLVSETNQYFHLTK